LSENFASYVFSYIFTSLTTLSNNINSVDMSALIQGTDFLFILLQQETIDSGVCEQAFEIIVKAIRTTNKKLTQNCCDLLKLPKLEVEILKQKVLTTEILLEVLKRHLGDKNIVTSSISSLRNLIRSMNEEEINEINDKGLIELILKYLNDNSSFTIADSQLVFDFWRILHCATRTVNAANSARFAWADGFLCFRRYQRLFSDDVDILRCMVNTICSMSWQFHLRKYFCDDVLIPLLISLLNVHVDCLDLSHRTAQTLAHFLDDFKKDDSLWSIAGIDPLEFERKITRAILAWDILEDRRVGWNTLDFLIARILQSENLIYQLLEVWELANLVLTNSAKYCPLFINEGGLPPLQRLLDDPQTNENVRFYARIAHEKLEKWQQISISQ
jgi:hypothetical protein